MAFSPNATLADYVVPARASRSGNLVRNILLIIGFSLFIALCARLSFYLPFSPVPVTMQTLAVLLTGAALGSRRGALAMLLYLAEGVAGLPFFAGGSAGLGILLGFTGGYLISYPIAAFVTGLLCERGWDRRFFTCILAMLPGTVIIYALGVTWLCLAGIPTKTGAFMHPNFLLGLQLGMVPFLIGDLLKLIIAVALLPTAWFIIGRTQRNK